jgi:hypothetical protein
MDEQTERSSEDFATLAVTNPAAWLQEFISSNNMCDGPGEYGYHLDYTKPLGGLIMIEVASDGGYEGGGEYTDKVYAVAPEGNIVKGGRVKDAAFYVRYSGSFSSYNGTEWDEDPQIVKPVDVTVVQYHPA